MIRRLAITAALLCSAQLAPPPAAQAQPAPLPLRAVGHFSQNTKQIEIERAFYGSLPQASGLNLAITFNPMDQIGLQAADALRHLRSGTFDVMAVLIGQTSRDEPFFDGMDLIGVSTNVADLRKAVDAGRESFDRRLQERFNARVMAIWPFGPQYFFCNAPVRSVADLRGLKVRSYTPSMTALLQHWGAIPVTLQFSEVYPALQRGLVTCGVTSAVSAYAGNWGEVTTHVLPLSVAGGIQGHFMSMAAWRRFNPEQQAALTTAFKRLEDELWDFARVSDTQSLDCLAGKPECAGRRFTSVISAVPPEDDARVRDAVSSVVLPTFRDSCNRIWGECAAVWNRTVGAARGYTIP
jgi:TRAP-type C4-dicarboxylate transport system substrate-binding protein